MSVQVVTLSSALVTGAFWGLRHLAHLVARSGAPSPGAPFPRAGWGKGPSIPRTSGSGPCNSRLSRPPVTEGVREGGVVRKADGDAAQPGRRLPGDGATSGTPKSRQEQDGVGGGGWGGWGRRPGWGRVWPRVGVARRAGPGTKVAVPCGSFQAVLFALSWGSPLEAEGTAGPCESTWETSSCRECFR